MGTDQVFGMDAAGDGSGGDYCGTVFSADISAASGLCRIFCGLQEIS